MSSKALKRYYAQYYDNGEDVWDDMVLADDAAREIERLEGDVRVTHKIYKELEFVNDRLDARVRELTAELEGANVCGKAMQQERDQLKLLLEADAKRFGDVRDSLAIVNQNLETKLEQAEAERDQYKGKLERLAAFVDSSPTGELMKECDRQAVPSQEPSMVAHSLAEWIVNASPTSDAIATEITKAIVLEARVRELEQSIAYEKDERKSLNAMYTQLEQERDRLCKNLTVIKEIIAEYFSTHDLPRFLGQLNYQGVICD